MSSPLKQLSEEGVSIWLDDLSRHRLISGDLEDRIRAGEVVGVTTNPAIFHKALRDVSSYELQLRELAQLGIARADVLRILTCHDVRDACDLLRPVYESTDAQDGRVSIEVDPAWAHDTQRTVAEARLLWWLVDRPNAMIKIPATPAGLRAFTACLAEGISVNVTLIFSRERYREVIDAHLDGMEMAHANGHDLSKIASVASFFVSRVDTEVDRRLDAIDSGAARALRGHAAIANARLAYETFEQTLRDSRWAKLTQLGAQPQRPLWASTGVKDPTYDDTRYVIDLVAPATVNTVPEATLAAVADHGQVRGDRITGRYAEARDVIDELAGLGIDIEEVAGQLEREGILAFQEAWRELTADVAKALTEFAPQT
ncbi:transaldolase [Nocardia carnea]|uniref:transaldolase n=1 Tax=Nocardia carnea TaxID=37328 RepID=UPI002453BCD5|nr:transaldolase [Nocardia carnea]